MILRLHGDLVRLLESIGTWRFPDASFQGSVGIPLGGSFKGLGDEELGLWDLGLRGLGV